MKKIENLKVIYFGDYMLSGDNDNLEEEFENEIRPQFARNGIEIEGVECSASPVTEKDKFDILMFDWGGASLGNNFMDSYIRQILRMAEAFPNRIFIMVSSMTEWAMKDAQDDGLTFPNIFLSVPDFCQYWKDLNKE